MKVHRWHDIRRERVSDKRAKDIRAQVEREIEQLNLRDVRKLAGKTQTEVAKAAAVAQGELSRLDRRQDHRVSTLRKADCRHINDAATKPTVASVRRARLFWSRDLYFAGTDASRIHRASDPARVKSCLHERTTMAILSL